MRNLFKILYIYILFNILCFCPVFGQVQLSRVELRTFFSKALGVEKKFNIYLPYGYDNNFTHYPAVYFLRNNEYEWFSSYYADLKKVADYLIEEELIGNIIIVGPNTGSDGGPYAGLGVNMLRPDLTYGSQGIGTGLFEDYIVELINYVDKEFRTIPDRNHRGIDGFSFGGYSSTMLALKHPELFCSIGSYDGTLMWLDLDDIRFPGPYDCQWTYNNTEYVFDSPQNIPYTLLHSASNILTSASPDKLDSIRTIRFHISCGVDYIDQIVTNHDQNMQFLSIMRQKGIRNSIGNGALYPTAKHKYRDAELHATGSLIKHWQAFNGTQISSPGIVEFSTVNCGFGDTTEVVVFNYGPDSLTIYSINNSVPVFQVTDVPSLPKILCAGDTISFKVKFNPQQSIAYSDLIQITSNDPVTPVSKIILQGEGIIDVSISEPLPSTFQMYQNYPNPFNPLTTISYQIPNRCHVTLKVFDIQGREVYVLVDKIQDVGYKSVNFDAGGLAGGIYFYRIQADSYIQTKKLLLLK